MSVQVLEMENVSVGMQKQLTSLPLNLRTSSASSVRSLEFTTPPGEEDSRCRAISLP